MGGAGKFMCVYTRVHAHMYIYVPTAVDISSGYVNKCVCIYTRVRVCVWVRMCVGVGVRVCVGVASPTPQNWKLQGTKGRRHIVRLFVHVCIYAYIHMCMSVCMCLCMCVCVCVCVCVCSLPYPP